MLPVRGVVQVLRCPIGHYVSHRSHSVHVGLPRQVNVRQKPTKTFRVHAQEQRACYRLTSVKEQTAEHRKRVLSKLDKSGMLFAMVRVCFTRDLFEFLNPALVYPTPSTRNTMFAGQ